MQDIYDAKQDPDFDDPYIDLEERRERKLADGRCFPYLYVHGGFRKKGVKFSFCFPEKEAYKGRFYQYLSPFPGPNEEVASLEKYGEDDQIAFCLMHGAYFVESNMGSKQMFGGSKDPTLVWKSSAAVAEFSRVKAMEYYGCGRPYGYVHGGSGGGYKSMACIENTCAWDGAVPYVIGSPVSLPNTITLHAQGQRALRKVFGKIVDALDAGGSGNMYEGLNEDEAFMLKEITQMGHPPKTWFLEATGLIDDGSLPLQIPHVKADDPEYFQDFWEKPGYLGCDKAGGTEKDRMQFTGIVKNVHVPGEKLESDFANANGADDAWKKMMVDGKDGWVELEETPEGELYFHGVMMKILTGEAAGRQLTLGKKEGNYLTIGTMFGNVDVEEILKQLKPGDQVFLDNSDYIAIQSYYRHQVPEDKSFHAWDQFRDEKGNAKIPQRPNVLGYNMSGTGTVQNGNIQGKTIVIQALMDESTCPWCGDWYRNKVIESKGSEADFRIYYMDRCMHGDVSWLENNMITNYLGALRQALLDISDWVERGIEPRKSTAYKLEDGQIYPEESADKRYGVQPSVIMTANGAYHAHVKVGEEILLSVRAEVPEDAGIVTAVDYDFESDETLSVQKKELTVFQNKGEFEWYPTGRNGYALSEMKHVYEKPGVYFASARVKIERNGDAKNPFTQIKNLGRVRITVE